VDVSVEIYFYHVQTTLVWEPVLFANAASNCKAELPRPVPPAAAAHRRYLSSWFCRLWHSRRKLQGRHVSLESMSPLSHQRPLFWSVKWAWASLLLVAALKQIMAKVYWAVLHLLGTTEFGGSAPLQLHVCSLAENPVNIKNAQHACAEAFSSVCSPARCSFCPGYWVVTVNCLVNRIFFYFTLG